MTWLVNNSARVIALDGGVKLVPGQPIEVPDAIMDNDMIRALIAYKDLEVRKPEDKEPEQPAPPEQPRHPTKAEMMRNTE